jgi:pectate lyase
MSKIFRVLSCSCWLLVCHCSNDAGSSVSYRDASNIRADATVATGGMAGISSVGTGGVGGTGGFAGAGGNVGAGGNTSGETKPIGGAISSGGTTSTGGLSASGGGNSAAGATSIRGTLATGGINITGGTLATGGTQVTGGTLTTGGTTLSGGTTANGGSKATGGKTANGGTSAAGGTKATGGTPAGGGITRTGGTSAAGGTASTGGVVATGGSGITTSGITCTPQTWASAPIGWATVSGATTGGGNATPTVVTSLSAFNTAAGGSGAAVIHVSGKISGVAKVGSNKTILGLCGAEIDGSVDLGGSSNVIMRNLKVVGYNCSDSPSDCSAGSDAVHVQGGDKHLWFDHMDISDGSDGNLDITHGCDFITVSWTKFHYSSQRTDPANNYGHRFSNLIGHDDANGAEDTGHLNVTFDHVWWADNVAERMPRVRFGKVHVFNSLYTATGDAACIEVGVSCNIRSENNVFQGVSNAVDSSHADSASIVQSIGNQGSSTNINPPAFAPSYGYTLEDVTTVATTVQAGAGPK